MTVGGIGANWNGILLQENTDIPTNIQDELTVEDYVNKYFSDIPVLVEVARCESQFRQHNKSGTTLSGLVNEYDKGVMQINEIYHLDKADKLGFDLGTLEGNTAYARFLFEKKGLLPWSSSAKCWKKTQAYVDYRVELALGRQMDR